MAQSLSEQLLDWIISYNPLTLQNEDDVESKFVIPLFSYLGYPANCRRGKYPIQTYRPGKTGRKTEIDQIYFSVADLDRQNSETSLIIVEAKEPSEEHLESAMKQALFYGYYLKPLLLFVTNGKHVIIRRIYLNYQEEVILDNTIEYLRDEAMLLEFFKQMNFETVKNLKEHVYFDRTHEQFARLEGALRRYPELKELIDKGDFETVFSQHGRNVISARPKVSVECTLPIIFRDGNYLIRFSNITRRNLEVMIGHEDILKFFLTDINTPPYLEGRRFLHRLETGLFEVQLGQATTTISEEEALDLCACVDDVSQVYRTHIITTENLLETWDYTPVEAPGFYGFYLFSVKSWLWDLMVKFSHEFDWGNGKSEWHIFERCGRILRVSNRVHDHAFLYPKIANGFWSVVPDDYVQVIYEVSENHLEFIEDALGSWRQRVGPLETWTARYARQWLLEKFVPKIFQYYSNECRKFTDEWQEAVDDEHNKSRPSLYNIDDIRTIDPYLEEVQEWFYVRLSIYFSTHLLRPYYSAFTNIFERCDPNTIDLDYMARKLANIHDGDGEFEYSHKMSANEKHSILVRVLPGQVLRINSIEFELVGNADRISRVFSVTVRDGFIKCSQADLNFAKEALIPLWNLSRFEMRYINPRWPLFPF